MRQTRTLHGNGGLRFRPRRLRSQVRLGRKGALVCSGGPCTLRSDHGPCSRICRRRAAPPHPQEPPCGRLPPPSVVADSPPEDTGTALVGASVLACLLGECGPRSRRCSSRSTVQL